MEFEFSAKTAADLTGDTVICFATKFDRITDRQLREIDLATGGGLSTLLGSGEFTGAEEQLASFVNPDGFGCKRLLVVGLGAGKGLDADNFRRALGRVSREKGYTCAGKASLHFGRFADRRYFQAAVEGLLLGGFKHLDYKTDDDKDVKQPAVVQLAAGKKDDLRALKTAAERGRIIAEGQILVRRLSGTPPNDLTPTIYAKKAQKLARQHGVSCQVLDEKAIEREKMGALLGVAKGSSEPPRFIVLQYNGGRSGQKPVVLVGKGVTFDSGGISLKPGAGMHEMKQDMTGSAVVLATIITAARLKLPINLVSLMPTTENMPSGRATRPGDILTSRKGITIEIINTDAEGRLILADALDYADKFKPQAVIDIATLTGATRYILGEAGVPILGNNKKLLGKIESAAKVTAERVWPLPIWDDHREQMKSPIADLVNSGGRSAGTIAATAFLENFIGDWPWAHIDIAMVDMESKGKPYVPKGASGFGLRLLTEVLAGWKKI